MSDILLKGLTVFVCSFSLFASAGLVVLIGYLIVSWIEHNHIRRHERQKERKE